MDEPLQFVVYGTPQPAGSKRGFPITNKTTGKIRVILTDANPKAKDWKGSVMAAASVAYDGLLLLGPLNVEIRLYFHRPKGDYGTGRNAGKLKPSAPSHKITSPDLFKCARGVEDALQGIVYKNDSQIVVEKLEKFFCGIDERPRAEITVIEL